MDDTDTVKISNAISVSQALTLGIGRGDDFYFRCDRIDREILPTSQELNAWI